MKDEARPGGAVDTGQRPGGGVDAGQLTGAQVLMKIADVSPECLGSLGLAGGQAIGQRLEGARVGTLTRSRGMPARPEIAFSNSS